MKRKVNYDVKAKVELIERDNKQRRIIALSIHQWSENYLLYPQGQFGTRHIGRKDSASARDICM